MTKVNNDKSPLAPEPLQLQLQLFSWWWHISKVFNEVSIDIDASEEYTCIKKLIVIMQ